MAKAVDDDFNLDEFEVEDEGESADKPKAKAPKALRDYAARQAAENKELRERLAKFDAQERGKSLEDVLKSKGVPEDRAGVIAGLYPKDAEASAEAVDAWLESYSAAFGITRKDSAVEADEQANMSKVFTAGQTAPPADSSMANTVAEMKAAPDNAALDAILARVGAQPRT